jgi:DNA-binding Xre family transcriptional regulator
MNSNQKRQDMISFAMYKNKITKLELAEELGFSYPTMLSKLKDTGTFKLSEFENLCNYLNIEVKDFINPLNK